MILFFCCTAAFASQTNDDLWNSGPLYDRFPLTLSQGHRTEIAGPLFYSQTEGSEKLWAIPPLIVRRQDPDTDSEEFNFGFPALTYHRYGTEYRWELGQIFSISGGQNQSGTPTKRFTIFPIYFQQRSPQSNLNYTAVLPFYGHLVNRLFMDEISWVMAPVYVQTRKNDVVSDYYPFPFFERRHGPGLTGWHLWPLYGHEHKDLTTKTNNWGDVEPVPGYDRHFALWPIYLDQTSGIGTNGTAHQQALLPFYSYARSPQRDSTTVIWPLITHITDREKNYREWETPWPLIVFARGPGKTTSRVFPFYSHAATTNLESDWYLWPVYKMNRLHVGALERSRMRLLLFLYSDTIQKNTELGIEKRRVDLWPLFTHQRDYHGKTRLQIFAPLEPILPYSPTVEQEYSPVWSVWRSEHNPETGASSQSLLWNLYRRDATPNSKKCSLLFGLFQYQSNPKGKRLRLFYIPVINTLSPQKKANSQ